MGNGGRRNGVPPKRMLFLWIRNLNLILLCVPCILFFSGQVVSACLPTPKSRICRRHLTHLPSLFHHCQLGIPMALCPHCQTLDFRFVGYYRPELDYPRELVAADVELENEEEGEGEGRSEFSTTLDIGENETDGDDHDAVTEREHDGELSAASDTSSSQRLPGNEDLSLREVLDRKDVCLFCRQISSLFSTLSRKFWPNPTEQDLDSGQVSFSGEAFGVVDEAAHTRRDDTLCVGNVSVTLNPTELSCTISELESIHPPSQRYAIY